MATFLKIPSDEGMIRTTVNTLPPNPQVGWYVLLSAILGSSVDAQRVKLGGIQLPAGINSQVHAALKLAVGESFVSGFRLAALVCAGLALAGALCGWLMIEDMPSKRASGAATGERAVDKNELSVSTAPGGLPGAHA